ncbi:hypothetical protein RSAG8_11840, partial [Rhizoctonia solani AG-8 WAC10335]
MLLALMAPALALVIGLCPLPTDAFPSNVDVKTRAFYPPSSSNSSKLSGVGQAIISIVLVLFCIFCAFMAAACQVDVRNPRGQGRESSTRCTCSTPVDRAQYHGTTVNYTSNMERAASGNAPIETRRAEAGDNNGSVRSIIRTNGERPTQHSVGSLPLYKEQAPDGEIVLLERVCSMPDGEDDRSGDETEITPLTGAAPPYTGSSRTSEVPQVIITTTGSPRSSMSSVESLRGRSENLVFDATATVSSINVTECEHTGAGVHTLGTPVATISTATPLYGDAPTYEGSDRNRHWFHR